MRSVTSAIVRRKRGGGWVGQEQYVGRYRYAVHRVYLCIVHRYTYTYTAILRQSL